MWQLVELGASHMNEADDGSSSSTEDYLNRRIRDPKSGGVGSREPQGPPLPDNDRSRLQSAKIRRTGSRRIDEHLELMNSRERRVIIVAGIVFLSMMMNFGIK
jgi:hypothetical protein